MLGSISQLFDFDEQTDVINANNIQSTSLLRLLLALEQTNIDSTRDDYSILELIRNDSSITKIDNTPITNLTGIAATIEQGTGTAVIKSLDFCYADDENIFTLLSCFDVCVTVGKGNRRKIITKTDLE